MSAARIGKITMKNGGAEDRLIRQALPNGKENYRGVILEHARTMADQSDPGSTLIGFVMVGLYSDGKSSMGCRYDPKTSPIPTALFPAYIAEIIRRDLITATEAESVACDVFNRSI